MLGGALCGGLAKLTTLLSPFPQVVIAGVFGAVILVKEVSESRHQTFWKTVVDSLAWIVPFVVIIAIGRPM